MSNNAKLVIALTLAISLMGHKALAGEASTSGIGSPTAWERESVKINAEPDAILWPATSSMTSKVEQDDTIMTPDQVTAAYPALSPFIAQTAAMRPDTALERKAAGAELVMAIAGPSAKLYAPNQYEPFIAAYLEKPIIPFSTCGQ